MRSVSFYHKESGVLSSYKVVGDDNLVALNTPTDHMPIDGHHDHLRKRVNVETKEVIDYQPPAPSENHVWDDGTKAWQLSPEAMAKDQRRRAANARLAALEMAQQRPLRELALSPGDPVATAKLKAINDEISALRADL